MPSGLQLSARAAKEFSWVSVFNHIFHKPGETVGPNCHLKPLIALEPEPGFPHRGQVGEDRAGSVQLEGGEWGETHQGDYSSRVAHRSGS